MRKFVLAAVAAVFSFGLALAAEVTFVSYEKEGMKLTVKDGDKETTYTVSDKTTFKSGDKDMPNDKGTARLEKMGMSDKAKGKAKIEITVNKDNKSVDEIKLKGRKN